MTVKELFEKAYDIKTDVFISYVNRYWSVSEAKKMEKETDPSWEADFSYLKRIYEKFEKGYEDILKTEPVPHPETICLVHPFYWSKDIYASDWDVSCIDKDELLEKYKETPEIRTYDALTDKDTPSIVETYCFMYEPREDILGYEMSEVSLERYPLKDLAAAVFFELTWFGFTNENAEEGRLRSREELDEAIEEVKELENSDDEDDILDFSDAVNEDNPVKKDNEMKAAVKNYNEAADYFKEVYGRLKNAE